MNKVFKKLVIGMHFIIQKSSLILTRRVNVSTPNSIVHAINEDLNFSKNIKIINLINLDRQVDVVSFGSVLGSPFAQVENIKKYKSIFLKNIQCLGGSGKRVESCKIYNKNPSNY